MPRVTLLLLAVVLASLATEGRRMRRGFNNSGYGSGGYGRGSDERDASVSQENNGGGCNSSNDRSYSGSRELAYSRDGRQPGQTRGGRSFTRSSASATASAAASAQHHKNNLVL